MERLSVGDTVQLKSGGPIMTINAVLEKDASSQALKFHYITNKNAYPEATYLYICSWFIKDEKGNDESKSQIFPDYALKSVTP